MNETDRETKSECWDILLKQAANFLDANELLPHTAEQQYDDLVSLLETARAIGATGTGECQPMYGAGIVECSVCNTQFGMNTYRYCPGCGCRIIWAKEYKPKKGTDPNA